MLIVDLSHRLHPSACTAHSLGVFPNHFSLSFHRRSLLTLKREEREERTKSISLKYHIFLTLIIRAGKGARERKKGDQLVRRARKENNGAACFHPLSTHTHTQRSRYKEKGDQRLHTYFSDACVTQQRAPLLTQRDRKPVRHAVVLVSRCSIFARHPVRPLYTRLVFARLLLLSALHVPLCM